MTRCTALVLAVAVFGSFGSVGHAQEATPAPTQGPPPVMAPPPPLAPPPTNPPPATPVPSTAEPEPSTGMGGIIAGWILVGVGAVNLASVPLCSELYTADMEDTKDLCVVSSVVVGVAGVGIGVPLLISGYVKRSRHKAWAERNGVAQALLNTRIVVQQDAAFLGYSTSF